MRSNNMSSKAGLAVILMTLAGSQATGWGLGRFTAAAIQTATEDAGFGGYRIVNRLSRPNAPIGGGRSPFPRLVFEDNRGRFWIAHVNGRHVQLYDERTGVWDMFSDRDSDSDGIHHHGDALLPSHITHICQSKDGIMWFSDEYFLQESLGAGKDRLFLTSFDGKQWRSFPLSTTSKCSIGLIQSTDGRVWSWAMDELRYWERGRWSEPTRISDVLKDPAPQPPASLAGTSKGQEILERYRTRYEILGAMEDREGYLWLTTYSGVFTYNPRTREFRRYPALRDERAGRIYEDHQGRIWFNEFDMATMYDRSKGTVTSYNPLDHIVRQPPARDDYSIIVGICQDRRGRMIFACAEGLVILSEIENRWSVAATKGLGLDAELVRNTLMGIMEDSKGRIWLPGFTGIAILDQAGVPAPLPNPGRNPGSLRVR